MPKKRQKIAKVLSPRHMTPQHLLTAIRLRSLGASQLQVAQALQCSQSTVSELLRDTTDLRSLAQMHVRSQSYDVAKRTMQKVLDDPSPDSGIRVLEDLSVLPRAEPQGGVRVDISLGSPTQPAGEDPFGDRDLGQVIDMSTIPVLDD